MKKILYVHHVSAVGGGSYCLLNVLKEVDRSLITPIVLLKDDGPLVEEIKKMNIEVCFLPSMSTVPYNRSLLKWGSVKSYLQAWLSVVEFKKIVNKTNVDAVYLNNMMLYLYLKPSKECNKKAIIHIREHWPLNEHTVQLNWARKAVYMYADQVLAINQYSASIFPEAEQKLRIVYDWIDFKDRNEDISMSKLLGEDAANLKVYLFTGGLQKVKGTHEIIRVFSKYITEKNERLLILGINTKQMNIGKNALIRNLLSRIGYKTYSFKVLEAINKDCRVVCIPSTYKIKHILEQTYCNISYFTIPHANLALAEAIILQIPSIAAQTPESIEYSNNGNLAVLFCQNNEKDFAEKMELFKNNIEELKARLRNDSYLIEDMFDRSENVQKLNQIYKSLLS